MRYLLAGLMFAAFAPLAFANQVLPTPTIRPQLLADEISDDADEDEGGLPDAELALDVGRYSSAKLEFKKVVKAEPGNQSAARGLAETYSQLGDYKLAVRALEKCIEEVECEEREREAFTEETDFDPRRVPPGYVARRLKDGIWTEYSHEGRRIDETAWLNGQREGMHYCWFADGTIQQSGPYVDGRQDGLWSTWSQTGQLVSEVTWSRGVMDGSFRGYFASGVIQCEGNYAAGCADGAWNYYNEDGTLRETQYPKEKLRELKDEGSERCGVRLR